MLITILCMLFFGYPFVLWVLSKAAGTTVRKTEIFPSVSIVIPCYNERQFIEKKIRNTLYLDYPESKRELIMVDSGSTDGTTEVLERYSADGKIKLLKQHERLGKPAAINEALKVATGEIVVMTDADAMLDVGAVTKIVSCFSDSSVGAAVGNLKLTQGKTLVSKMNSAFFYLFREGVRELESKIDSVSYFSGELLAFRKDVLEQIDPTVVSDDLFILFEIRKRGYRCVSEKEAFVFEKDVETIGGQLSHKRRTVVGSLQVFKKNWKMLFNPSFGWFGVLIFPAYVLRFLLCPILLFSIEALFLFSIPSLIKSISLLFGMAFAFLLIVGFLMKRFRIVVFGVVYGLLVQVAILMGIVDHMTGNYSVLWAKKGR